MMEQLVTGQSSSEVDDNGLGRRDQVTPDSVDNSYSNALINFFMLHKFTNGVGAASCYRHLTRSEP